MEFIDVFLAVILSFSLVGNVLLTIFLLKTKKKANYDADATDLLHDMTVHGQAVVRIFRVDPNDIFLRSPSR